MSRLRELVFAGALCVQSLMWGCVFDPSGGAELPGDEVPPREEPQVPIDQEPGDAEPQPPPVLPVAFRVTSLALRDPHMFAFVGGFGGGCDDITDGGASSVNALIAESFGGDNDGDGFIDRSVVLVLEPFEAPLTGVDVSIMNARCTADGTTCTAEGEPVATFAEDVGAPACDVPPAEVTSGYSPPIEIVNAPCFTTAPVEFTLGLDSPVPQQDFVVAATYSPDSDELTGTFRGFLREADADVVPIDTGTTAVVISRFLPGGDGACSTRDDRDPGPDGDLGWYVYFQFTAVRL